MTAHTTTFSLSYHDRWPRGSSYSSCSKVFSGIVRGAMRGRIFTLVALAGITLASPVFAKAAGCNGAEVAAAEPGKKKSGNRNEQLAKDEPVAKKYRSHRPILM